MSIYRLKTESEESMIEQLKTALYVVDGELVTATHDYFVSLIGDLRRPTGNIIGEGDDAYPEMELLDGYHANLVTDSAEIISTLESITIEVKSPLIKIAGEA